jgi:hypothetical protein
VLAYADGSSHQELRPSDHGVDDVLLGSTELYERWLGTVFVLLSARAEPGEPARRDPIALGDLRDRIVQAFAEQRARVEHYAEPAQAAHRLRARELIHKIQRLEEVAQA